MKSLIFQERERNEALRRERSYLRLERKLWKRGFKRVACLDEAGRGPLAGSVFAAAVMIIKWRPNFLRRLGLLKINDSKKLTPQKREELYKILIKCPDIKWGVGKTSERVIDRINILEATKLAMKRAVLNLKSKINYLIIDGNFGINLPIPQKSIIKADEKIFSCMAASIIAKVSRDRMMKRFDKKFPKYGFYQHKGYPTKNHIMMLKKYGTCVIHRNSFRYGGTKTKTH